MASISEVDPLAGGPDGPQDPAVLALLSDLAALVGSLAE